tara:strand:- start:64 stop:525 length:462 start_codon:yes stop_codon:yes gene_type:complete
LSYKIFKNVLYKDYRGGIEKNLDFKLQKKLNFKVIESCFSFSKKGTLRGIYIQTGKMMEKKIITLLSGKVSWFIMNYKNTKYRRLIKLKKNYSLYIPAGYAHGCYAHEDSILHIISDKKYNEKYSKHFSWYDKQLNIKYIKNFKKVMYKDKTL